IVGVLGHRQVGKTTLLEELSSHYLTLDTKVERSLAEQDPDGFVDRFSHFPVGIDESQLCPPLFPALKDRVRRVKIPGQFILTGSVRFTSRKVIKESLTGRIINVEMHPLMISELIESPEPRIAKTLLDAADLEIATLQGRFKISKQTLKDAEKSLQLAMRQGGLPGVCFVRNPALRAVKFESHLETILTRDLRLLIETTLEYDSVRRVLENISLSQGQPLEFAALSRKARVSIPTLRRLIAAFEAMFLIWRLPCIGGEKRPAFFFEDAGEGGHLHGGRLDALSEWTACIATQLRSVFDIPLSGKENSIVDLFQFRTRSGAFVPLGLRRGKRHLGIIPILSQTPSPKDLGSGASFLKAFSDSRVAFVSPSAEATKLRKDTFLISGGLILL
ncbi:MAG: AAA family ATPase, partial [Proteobacteria bacterium]|nr:AAA family ATPase [Pseudomonadota bacterium]